jgi:asparagine synthase (glutamine-hydrolysing)
VVLEDDRRFGLNPAWDTPMTVLPIRSFWFQGPRRVICAEALHGYLCLSHVPWPLSIFEGRRRIDALPTFAMPDSDTVDDSDILRLLEESVARRLPADPTETVGVALSGGLDSALVAALCVRAGARVKAFTLDFGEPWNVEVGWAKQVADFLGIPCRVVDAGPERVASALDPAAVALPEPYGDAVVPGLWLLGDVAKDEVGLLMNGEGGDQLFGGWANKPMLAAQAYGVDDELEQYLRTYHRFLGLTERLYTRGFRNEVRSVAPDDWIRPAFPRDSTAGWLHRLRAANIALKGFQNIAPRCAFLARCHGLRCAAPFFDSALAQATFSLPEISFLDGVVEKPILKRIARGLLPDAVVDRPKRGMGAPAQHWLSGSHASARRARALLSPRRLRREGRFDIGFVQSLQSGHDPSPESFRPRRVGEKLWTLFFWEHWRQVHGLD